MKAFYGSRFSPNMTRTPEGFLICHNVPIARTGWYKYLKSEIGLEGNEVVDVHRSKEEVFSKAAIASFEGKIVTDEHPPEKVTPSNSSIHTKGVVQNVRQSKEEKDLLLADLLVYQKQLIEEILDGKREVSCGYDFTCIENEDSTYSQIDIRGNHVAVVTAGRAGSRVSIKDTSKELGGKNMSKKFKIPRKNSTATKFLAALGLKHFAMDADPEELADVVDEMVEESKDEDTTENSEAKDNGVKVEDEVSSLTKEDLAELITNTVRNEIQALNINKDSSPEEAIDNLISELESNDSEDELEGNDEESSGTIEADDEDILDGEVSPENSRPQNPIQGADSKVWAEALKAIKPTLAKIKDPKERQTAYDSLANAYKNSQKKSRKKNTYSDILKAQRRAARDSANNQKQVIDYTSLGDDIAKRHNANLKGGN